MTWVDAAVLAAAYLLGSVPFGLLLVRWRRGEDVRDAGSGNIGATNVTRRAGAALGAGTLLLDAGKGIAAAALARSLSASLSMAPEAAAVAAMAGHVFPPWLGFRGGKGVATGAGAFGLLDPRSVLVSAGIFVAGLGVFRRVSAATLLATLVFVVRALWIDPPRGDTFPWSLAGSLLIVWSHRANMSRLFHGTEPPLGLLGRGRGPNSGGGQVR